MKSETVTTEVTAIEQYFPVGCLIYYIKLYKVVLTFSLSLCG